MAHEVETMMAANGRRPWHFAETGADGRSVVVEHAPTAAEAIQLARLDWKVDLRPVFDRKSDGSYQAVGNRFNVVRDSDEKVLSVVGSNWRPLQNAEAFDFLDNLVDDGLRYDTAGSLRGGEVVFIAAKMPNQVLIGGQDAHDLYLFVRNAFNGRDAVTVGITPIRIECMNKLNLAMTKLKRSWSCPHLTTMKGKLAEARHALDLSWAYMDAWVKTAEDLIAQPFTDKDLERFMDKLMKDAPIGPKAQDAAKDGIRTIWSVGAANASIKGTKWGAVNAVGEYYDWVRPIRSEEARLLNSVDGLGTRMRDKALALLS